MTHFRTVLTLTALTCLGFSIGVSNTADAQSLWQRRDARMNNPYSDVRAHAAGDLLFVTINEQSDVQNKDKRTLKKTNSSSSNADGTYTVGGGLGAAAGNLGFDQNSAANRLFNGDTQYKSEREFIDRFTVMVVDTLPNGNLLISGSRNVSLEGDNRNLVLTGVVRGVDVNRNNSVSSQMISNLMIRYETADDGGAERKFINQGWLGRKFNRAWPY